MGGPSPITKPYGDLAMIQQARYVKGGFVTQPCRAGQVQEAIFSFTFDKDLPTTDILELAALPPFAKLMAVDLDDQNMGALNWTIGFMSGRVGDPNAARTSGAELFNAQAAGTPASMTVENLAAIAATAETPLSIGVKTSALIAAGATKKIHLRVRYIGAD